MKKKLLIIILLLTQLAWSQTNKKFLLVQHYTSTKENNCVVRNPGTYKSLDSLQTDIIHFQIHGDFPYTDDDFFVKYPIQNAMRKLQNVQSAPVVYINGIRGPIRATPTIVTTDTVISKNIGKTSEIGLKVTETGAAGSRNIKVDLKSFKALTGTNYRLFVVLVQRQLDTLTSNAEKSQVNVIRRILTDSLGNQITLPAVGSTSSYNFTTNLNMPGWDATKIYAIAFVMDQVNRSSTTIYYPIINSATQFLTSGTDDLLPESLVEISPNPVKDQLNVQLYNNMYATNYEIFNLSGQLMQKNDIEKSLDNFNIYVDRLNIGMYILKINTNEGIITKKFVKN